MLQAGTKENVIPDEALIKLNVRTFDAGVRKRVLEAIERIVNAEAELRARRARPRSRRSINTRSTSTTRQASEAGGDAFRAAFRRERVPTGPAPASEDFGCFGTAWDVPSVFWFVGGTDPEVYAKAKAEGRLNELPVNHSPAFAAGDPSTLETGVEAIVTAALAWLRPTGTSRSSPRPPQSAMPSLTR